MTYAVVTWLAETTTGGAVYLARHPELPGCCAQGDTPGEARVALDEVRAAYLAHLAAHKLPVPEPRMMCSGDTVCVDVAGLP